MKQIPNPIQTGHVDLSRSQLQSPFALVQFLESGFGGIPTVMDAMGPSPTVSSTQAKTRKNQTEQSLRPVVCSPIELTHLKTTSSSPERGPSVPLTFDSLLLQDITTHNNRLSVSSVPKDQQNDFTAPPLKRQNSSSLGKQPPSKTSKFISSLWSHLPALVIILAFVTDMPLSSGLSLLPSISVFQDNSSVMLSCTLCGMLLFWLAGCAMLALIGFVVYEIVSVIKDDGPSRGTAVRPWEWFMPI